MIEEELKSQEIEPHLLIRYLQELMKGHNISYDEKSHIISSMHNPNNRDIVGEFFKNINSPRQIDSLEALRTLGEILKYSLTAFIHDRDENYKLIYAILHSSQHVYHVKGNELSLDKQKTFLTNLLNDHGVWQETHVWKACIQKVLN